MNADTEFLLDLTTPAAFIGFVGFLASIALAAWLNREEREDASASVEGPKEVFMPGEFDFTGGRGSGATPIWKVSDIGTPERLTMVVLAQVAIADRFPRHSPGDPDPLGCVFKVYDEVGATDEDLIDTEDRGLVRPLTAARELLVEMKCALVLEAWAGQYSLTWRSLRGTECWRLIHAFTAVLGEPRSMILSDDRQATVYYPRRTPA